MRFFRPVNSEIIKELAYDKGEHALYLRFHQTDKFLYKYKDVPPRKVWELLSATSTGSYFSKKIKNKFEFEKLTYEDFVKSRS